jgi:hypothetical protein
MRILIVAPNLEDLHWWKHVLSGRVRDVSVLACSKAEVGGWRKEMLVAVCDSFVHWKLES